MRPADTGPAKGEAPAQPGRKNERPQTGHRRATGPAAGAGKAAGAGGRGGSAHGAETPGVLECRGLQLRSEVNNFEK